MFFHREKLFFCMTENVGVFLHTFDWPFGECW